MLGILCDVCRCSMGRIVMSSGCKGTSIFMLLICLILQRLAVCILLFWMTCSLYKHQLREIERERER